MKVFISWSGERSQALANALRELIPLVLHYVEPWLSEADIAAGARWAEAVAKELEESNFGIICVTRENVSSPWVLFEAGALAKSMQESRVIPLLLDLDFRDVTGPLAQFQAKKVEKSGLSEVIQSVNQAANLIVAEPQAKKLFEALWPQFEEQIASIPKLASSAKHSRPQHEVLEELVAGIRNLDSRLRDFSDEPMRTSRLRRKRFHPFIIHKLAHKIGEEPGDFTSLLILSSMLREEIPWLYELGIDAYRTATTGPPEKARRALRQFQKAIEFSRNFPPEELGIDSKALYMIVEELEHFLMREPNIERQPKARTRRKKDEIDFDFAAALKEEKN